MVDNENKVKLHGIQHSGRSREMNLHDKKMIMMMMMIVTTIDGSGAGHKNRQTVKIIIRCGRLSNECEHICMPCILMDIGEEV